MNQINWKNKTRKQNVYGSRVVEGAKLPRWRAAARLGGAY
jgi:hypothetical protein